MNYVSHNVITSTAFKIVEQYSYMYFRIRNFQYPDVKDVIMSKCHKKACRNLLHWNDCKMMWQSKTGNKIWYGMIPDWQKKHLSTLAILTVIESLLSNEITSTQIRLPSRSIKITCTHIASGIHCRKRCRAALCAVECDIWIYHFHFTHFPFFVLSFCCSMR